MDKSSNKSSTISSLVQDLEPVLSKQGPLLSQTYFKTELSKQENSECSWIYFKNAYITIQHIS